MVLGNPRRYLVAAAALLVLVAVAIWIIVAVPASAAANATYSPRLASSDASSTKLAGGEAQTARLRTESFKKYTPVPKPVRVTRAAGASARSARMGGSGEVAAARTILAGLIAKHPILAGSTVDFGDARGYQAICYYKGGRIVISPTHTASLERILNHEIWHIIDWRDNGRIDWGENIPPK